MRQSITLKPVLVIEIFLVVLLVGVGSAMAFTHSQTVADDDSPLGGIQYELVIADSGVTVTDYEFTYDAGLLNVTGVTGNLAGTDGDKCHVVVDVGDDDWSPHQWGRTGTVLTISGSTAFSVTLDSPILVDNVTKLNIIVEETVNA